MSVARDLPLSLHDIGGEKPLRHAPRARFETICSEPAILTYGELREVDDRGRKIDDTWVDEEFTRRSPTAFSSAEKKYTRLVEKKRTKRRSSSGSSSGSSR